jgi:hypothetical protein
MASSGDEIRVVRRRGLVEVKTWWIPCNAPSVETEKEDASNDAQQNSQTLLSYRAVA